jgi:DNA-binding NtrC family response regulator
MTTSQKLRKTVFVLDMEHNVRELVRRWMMDEGYRIVVFQDATACLKAISEDPPDVVLADVLTASLAGMEIVERIASLSHETCVILIYQLRLTETAMHSVRAGAFDYLAKPLERPRLCLAVRNALTVCELEAENRRLHAELFKRRRSSIPALSAGMGSMKELERKAIKDALRASNGNISKAARTLGLGRTTLYRKISAFGLETQRNGSGDNTLES